MDDTSSICPECKESGFSNGVRCTNCGHQSRSVDKRKAGKTLAKRKKCCLCMTKPRNDATEDYKVTMTKKEQSGKYVTTRSRVVTVPACGHCLEVKRKVLVASFGIGIMGTLLLFGTVIAAALGIAPWITEMDMPVFALLGPFGVCVAVAVFLKTQDGFGVKGDHSIEHPDITAAEELGYNVSAF